MDDITNQNAVPGATPVVPTPASDEPVVTATPGEVSEETPAGAPAPTAPVGEEVKIEEAPVTPVV